MRKIFLLSSLSLLLAQGLEAQYVTIPDPNFRAELMQALPNCFNALQELDTTCADIGGLTTLEVPPLFVQDLDGVQYLYALTSLYCRYNQLTSMPNLPASLRELDCEENTLTSLSMLPPGLEYLNCAFNQLTSLPALPQALRELHCMDNQLASLPILPAGLLQIDCEYNQLTGLPNLPLSLEHLSCSYNQLTSLPALPAGLRQLYCQRNQISGMPALSADLELLVCHSNQLTALPVLPTGLVELDCQYNQLSSLPGLPPGLQVLSCNNNQLTGLPSLNAGLKSLYCYYNQLTSLPALPTGLWHLMCANNQLTGLPNLPAELIALRCESNQLTSLPSLPDTLAWMYCNDNPFLSCLPMLPNGLYLLGVSQTAIPCLPNNTNYLTAGTGAVNFLPLCTDSTQVCNMDFPSVMGNVYRDLDGNGQFDPGEPRVGGAQINGLAWPTFSSADAPYWLYLAPDTLNPVWVNAPYPAWNVVPDTHYIVAPLAGLAPDTLNFGLQPAAPNAQDLQVALAAGPARPGFNTSASANALNAGTSAQAVTFSMTFPVGWTLLSTIPAGGNVAANTVTWQLPDSLEIFERDTFGLVLNVPANVPIGTPFGYIAAANLPVGELTPPDNSASFSGIVGGAYDPNDKLVSPETLPPGYDPEQELIYTIRFQNTGTDTAFNVLIRDTLAATLRPETFRMLHSSHACVPGFEGPRQLKFTFSNILLVDSFTNEPGSHGFVQFAIKPVAGLPLNTVLANRAGIYFDFNAPIITNYAETQVFLGVPQVPGGVPLTVRVFPNPAEQSTRFVLDAPLAGPATLTLFNALGQAVRGLELPAGTLGAELQRDGLPAGLYFFELADGGALRVAGRLVWR